MRGTAGEQKEESLVIYLKAGEMYLSDKPALVVTVLGSCLSVTMYCRRLGLGGICHGMLPACGRRKTCDRSCPREFKYVDCSIRKMVKLFERMGARRDEIEVKCFGGSDMFQRPVERPGLITVGRQNTKTAGQIIKHEGLTLVTHDTGGNRGRKLFFYTHTGEVLVKRLNSPAGAVCSSL